MWGCYKAKAKWALISRPLIKTGVDPRQIGLFYKTIVQAVLLHGSESWVITPQLLSILNGWHHRMARRIFGLMPTREHDGTWYYPPITDALEIAGLYTISKYIQVQQHTIAMYIVQRPIYSLCKQATTAEFQNNSRLYPLVV
jgi:hypothetical protein